jgi:isoleucyl-tRNA synthetase
MRTLSDYLGDLSAVYLDVLKDRLYADAADSQSRRSAQSVLARILGVLVRVLAPVLSFTCEEVWEFMPASMRDEASVHLSDWPVLAVPEKEARELRVAFGFVLEVREAVTKALEDARNDKRIGKSQEARVVVTAPSETSASLKAVGETALAELFIVSEVEVRVGEELGVEIGSASGEKCPRCWNYRQLGTDAAHPEVCARCAEVLEGLGR